MNELIHHGLLALRDCLPNDSELTTKVGVNVPSAPPNLSFLSPSSLFSPGLSLYIFTSLPSSFLPYHLAPFFSLFTFLPPFSPLSSLSPFLLSLFLPPSLPSLLLLSHRTYQLEWLVKTKNWRYLMMIMFNLTYPENIPFHFSFAPRPYTAFHHLWSMEQEYERGPGIFRM